ncbi:unnamed protein product [Prunus armeniaca]
MVAMDYFTKWVEAEAFATITAARIEDFVWTHICCPFGIPYAIIIVKLFFASPAHPQSNGQVKAINKIIKKLLKRQLNNAKGAWLEKLPEALWAIRTSFRTSTGEAVVPVEIGEPSD